MQNIKIKYTKFIIITFIIINILFLQKAISAQIYDIYPDTTRRIMVSKNEINRLHLQNDKIASIHLNKGDFTYKKSDTTGDLYFRIVTRNKNVNLFLETESGLSYQLLLSVKNIPSEQIILINPEKENTLKLYKNQPYKQNIISLIKDFQKGITPKNYHIDHAKNLDSKNKKWRKIRKRKNQSQLDHIKDFDIEPLEIIIPIIATNSNSYEITKYKIINKTKENIKIKLSDFSPKYHITSGNSIKHSHSNNNILAITADKEFLNPNQGAILIIARSL